MTTVADSSPLIYIAALSDFDLLRQIFGEIQLPPMVWTEIVDQGQGLPGCDAVQRAAEERWLRVTPLQRAIALEDVPRRLHAGEMASIQLALELGAGWLLMDDRRAIAYARSLGLRVAPVIAIYLMARRRGLVASVKPKIDLLRRAGFRLTDEHYREVLRVAGE